MARHDLVRLFFAPLAIAAGAACGSDPAAVESTSFIGAPIAQITSSPGGWSVTLRASPTTPARGVDAFELEVKDASGTAVDGLELAVVPWMSSHGHGASVVPEIKPIGGGVYVATDVELFMPGAWELRVTMRDATRALEEHATVPLTID